MKIKWKISLMTTGIIIALTLTIVIIMHMETKILVVNEINQELQNYSNLGLQVIDKSYPGDWSIQDGKLFKGDMMLNDNTQVVDEISEGVHIIITVFQEDTRVATTVTDANGQRRVGTQASEAIIQQVLTRGEVYTGTADVLGKSLQTVYTPIKNNTGEIIGMWSVGVFTDEVTESINNTMFLVIMISVILLIIGSSLTFVFGNMIAKKLYMVQERMKSMEQGQFNIEFPETLLSQKDEIGQIANSAKVMKDQIMEVLEGIKNESEKLKLSATEAFSLNYSSSHEQP
jgi:methyl-accepting chemotaxis protein